MLKKIINWILKLFNLNVEGENVNNEIKNEEIKYIKKDFMSAYELKFYEMLLELKDDYNIVPQINLATIITKVEKGYRNELFKNVDFGIFSKNFKKLLLLIEINDLTHNQPKRKKRDKNVKEICEIAGIKLITFHTKYPNEKQYVISRIKNTINEINKVTDNDEIIEINEE